MEEELDEEQLEEAKRLVTEWHDAADEYQEASSKLSAIEQQLEDLGVDPNNPPW